MDQEFARSSAAWSWWTRKRQAAIPTMRRQRRGDFRREFLGHDSGLNSLTMKTKSGGQAGNSGSNDESLAILGIGHINAATSRDLA